MQFYKRFKHPQTFYDLMKNKNASQNIQFDIKIDLSVSFIEFIAGFTKIVKYLREELWAVCLGKGCPLCKDSGIILRKKDIIVDVEPWYNENVVIFENAGHYKYQTNTYADLCININVKEHPIFKYIKPDVHSEYYLTISQAILGAKLNIYTIYGLKEIEIPPGSHHGDIVRIKGFGPKAPQKGDHVLNLKIDVPKKLNNKQESVLADFYQKLINGKTSI